MKKVIGLLILLVSFTVYAQQYAPESDFEVSPLDGGKSVAITKYVGSKREVQIPPTIQGFPVTHIGKSAFVNSIILTTVTIPDIKEIADFT